jgi:hypothetical protein
MFIRFYTISTTFVCPWGGSAPPESQLVDSGLPGRTVARTVGQTARADGPDRRTVGRTVGGSSSRRDGRMVGWKVGRVGRTVRRTVGLTDGRTVGR